MHDSGPSPPSPRWRSPPAAGDPSRRRPRPTSPRPPRPGASAVSSTWPSTRGSATRPVPTSSAPSPRTSSAAPSNYKDLKEDVSWQGFGTGEVDVVIEDWGHPDLEKKFFEGSGDGTATDFGPNGNIGIIGWYVPPWLADGAPGHPRLGEPQRVRRRSSRPPSPAARASSSAPTRRTSSSTRRSSSNLDLDFKVVFSGSEAASIEAFRQAEENKEFLIGYFYEPQYFMAEVPLEKVALPPYEEGCQDDPATVACDYPETTLKKIVSTEWAESDSTAVALVRGLRVDQRGPERRRGLHRRRQDGPRGRRGQVDRRRTPTRSRPGSTPSRDG